eukprot:s6149_g3.t1
MDPNYPASANPRTGMIGNDHQGMSPRRPTVLEGELIGPSNGVAATQPRRQQLGAEAPGDKAMANGVSSTEGMDPPRPDQDEGSQPVMSPPVPSVSDFLSTSAALNRDDQGATFSAGVPPEVTKAYVEFRVDPVEASLRATLKSVAKFQADHLGHPEFLEMILLRLSVVVECVQSLCSGGSFRVVSFVVDVLGARACVLVAGPSGFVCADLLTVTLESLTLPVPSAKTPTAPEIVRLSVTAEADKLLACSGQGGVFFCFDKASAQKKVIHVTAVKALIYLAAIHLGPGFQWEAGILDRVEPAGKAAGPSSSSGPAISDRLGVLVQVQTAMSESWTSRTKEPEVVKRGLTELPKLAEMGPNSAIDVGDWLHGLQNHMGDLSNNSGQWWSEVMQCLTQYYEAYLAASNVGKLTLRAEDYESALLKDTK